MCSTGICPSLFSGVTVGTATFEGKEVENHAGSTTFGGFIGEGGGLLLSSGGTKERDL